MHNCFQCGRILDLINSGIKRLRILIMTNTTIDKVIPCDFKLTELFLQQSHRSVGPLSGASKLQIIDMDGHHANKLAIRLALFSAD